MQGPLPPSATFMTNETAEPPELREGACPFCERRILVCEDPPRCPLCACPLDERSIRPYTFPQEPAAEEPLVEGES